MNKVLKSMLKGAFKNPVVFGSVLSFIADELGERVKKDGISESEEVLIASARIAHDGLHEFLTAVGEEVQ